MSCGQTFLNEIAFNQRFLINTQHVVLQGQHFLAISEKNKSFTKRQAAIPFLPSFSLSLNQDVQREEWWKEGLIATLVQQKSILPVTA